MIRPLLAAAVLGLGIQAASAGVVIEYKVGKRGKSTIYIAPNLVKIRHQGGEDQGGVIYSRKRKQLTLIDYDKQSYMEWSSRDSAGMEARTGRARDEMAARQGEFDAAQGQMEAAMADLPPEQRAMAQAMMGRRGMPGGRSAGAGQGSAKTVYTRGGKERVGKWSARHHVGRKGKRKVAEVWTVPYASAGLKKSEVALLKELHEEMGRMRGAAGSFSREDDSSDFFGGVDGLPVKYVMASSPGKTAYLNSVRRRDLGTATFRPPKGFSQHGAGYEE